MKIHDSNDAITIKVKDEKDLIPIKNRSALTIPVYHGVYEVIPNAHADVELNTAGKKLERNIVVEEIHYRETSNEYGKTVYIGE